MGSVASAVTAASAASAVAAAGGGGGGGGGNGVNGGGGGVAREKAGLGLSGGNLAKIDLAFPNNEHLLPISTFATEQGLTVPSSHLQVRMHVWWEGKGATGSAGCKDAGIVGVERGAFPRSGEGERLPTFVEALSRDLKEAHESITVGLILTHRWEITLSPSACPAMAVDILIFVRASRPGSWLA